MLIQDLQTNKEFCFICEKWFALDKDDGKINRFLSVSTEEQKKQLKYLLAKQTKSKFRDEHLWFSIFSRQVRSSFTRIDRLTCLFVLLNMSMVMNIVYYGIYDTISSDQLIKIGSLMISKTQVIYESLVFLNHLTRKLDIL